MYKNNNQIYRLISGSTFKLHILGGQDAHPTRAIFNSIMQIRCFLAYDVRLITFDMIIAFALGVSSPQ
jgi:hypothetical protein